MPAAASLSTIVAAGHRSRARKASVPVPAPTSSTRRPGGRAARRLRASPPRPCRAAGPPSARGRGPSISSSRPRPGRIGRRSNSTVASNLRKVVRDELVTAGHGGGHRAADHSLGRAANLRARERPRSAGGCSSRLWRAAPVACPALAFPAPAMVVAAGHRRQPARAHRAASSPASPSSPRRRRHRRSATSRRSPSSIGAGARTCPSANGALPARPSARTAGA